MQREAKEVREHASALIAPPQPLVASWSTGGSKPDKTLVVLPETGLEGALFGMLDTETDQQLRLHLQEAIMSLVLATSADWLSYWLALCKDVLASTSSGD